MTSHSSSEPHDAEPLPPGEHRRILARYRATQTGVGWHTAPDDGYLYAKLTYHLAALVETDPDAARELAGLFADHNWLHARAAHAGSGPGARYDGYLEDLTRYWNTVQRRLLGALAAGERCAALVDSIWCALLVSSVAAIEEAGTGNIAGDTTPESLEFDIWSALLALGVPISLLDARRKVETLLRIVGSGPEPQPPAAAASPHLPPEALRLQLAKLAAHTEEGGRGWEIYELVRRAALNELGEVLEATAAIGDEWVLVRVLYELAKRADGRLLRRMLAAAAAMTDEAARISALEILAPLLTGDLAAAAVRLALDLQEEGASAKIVYLLVPHLDAGLVEQLLTDVLAVADRTKRAQVFGVMAPRLPGSLLARVLPLVGGLARPDPALNLLAALVEQFELRTAPTTLAAIQQMALAARNSMARARLLARLAVQVDGPERRRLVGEAIAVLQKLAYGPHKVEVLQGLLPLLDSDELRLVYATVMETQAEGDRAALLSVLVPQLGSDLLPEVAAAAQQMQDAGAQGMVLVALAPQFGGHERRQLVLGALIAAEQTWNQERRCEILCALAPYLDLELRPAALARARLLTARDARTRALLAIGRYGQAPARDQLYEEALVAALRVQEPAARCAALLLLADEFDGTGQEQAFGAALAAAQDVANVAARALLLGKLAALRSGPARRKVILSALLTLQQVTDWRIHATVLAALAPHLDGSLMVMALVAVRKIDENIPRMRALAALLACPDSMARRSAWLQIADDLCYRFRTRTRAELYTCLTLPGLLAPPCVDAEMAAAIAEATMRLEQGWQWPV